MTENTYGIPPEVYQRRNLILAVMCLSLVLIVVAVSSLNVAIPAMQKALNASPSQLQWIVDAYSLVFAGALLPAGALGDRFGRKGALQFGLGIFAVFSFLSSFATSPNQVIAGRAFMGIGAALIMPATLSIIQSSFPPHERGKAIATWAGLAGAGGALGPLLSGTMLHWFEFGSVFLVNLPFIAILMLLTWFLIPTSKDPNGHPLDPIGSLLSVAGLVALVFAIIEGPAWGWGSGRTLGVFAIAIAFLIAFVQWELRAEHPTLDPRLFKLPGFGMGALTVTSIFFCMFGMFFLAVQYLQYVLGYSALFAGVTTLPSAAVMIAIAPRTPQITDKFGVRNTLRLGFVLSTLGFLGLATLSSSSTYWQFLPSLILLSGGVALIMPPATSSITASLPLSKAGVGSAVNDVTREVGGAVGIAVLGSIVNTIYRSHVDLSKAIAAVPEPVRATPGFKSGMAAASDGIGGAFSVAQGFTHPSKDQPIPPELTSAFSRAAKELRHAGSDAFMSGSRIAYVAAAVIGLVLGAIATSRIPDSVEMQTFTDDITDDITDGTLVPVEA